MQESKAGYFYAASAHLIWGLVPIYWKFLRDVDAIVALSFRIVMSAVFFIFLIVLLKKRFPLIQAFRQKQNLLFLGLSAFFICLNWFLFIYVTFIGRVLECSLAYFINPLMSVAIGMIFFRERLRPFQWISLGLAACGVALLVFRGDHLPWIALTLALSFAIYGAIRKKHPVEPIIGTTLESLFMLPVGLCIMLFGSTTGDFSELTWTLLLVSGVVSGIPLLLFAGAARNLRFSTLGFIQYITPSIQFCLAVFLYGEEFGEIQLISFSIIWLALIIFTYDLRRNFILQPVGL